MSIGFVFAPDNSCRRIESLEELGTLWSREDYRLWIHLESPSDSELQRLGEIAGLDSESLDDCLRGEQQPRIDEFDTYLFMVLYGLQGLKEREDVDPHQLAAFIGSRFLITVDRQPLLSVRQVRSRCGRHPERLLACGVDVVLFEIIDTIVDRYLMVADRFEDRLEDLEEQSFDIDVSEDILEQAADVRREVLELRRMAVAQRQLLLPVAKGEYDFLSETLSQQFSQVCDHLSQVVDFADSLRETIQNIRDNYDTVLTRRTNEIMKVLTVFAAVMLPLTLIAGVYGMNLRFWPPPDHPASFWGVMGAMAVIAAAMLGYFRHRGWV